MAVAFAVLKLQRDSRVELRLRVWMQEPNCTDLNPASAAVFNLSPPEFHPGRNEDNHHIPYRLL